MSFSSPPPRVAVIGGGLAGMATAAGLGSAGVRGVLYEARAFLGGRAASYTDSLTGDVIDNCQHVGMQCCTNFQRLCELLEVADQFDVADGLTFLSGAGASTRFCEGILPAPGHLAGSFLKLPWLSLREKWLFALAVRRLARTPPEKLRGVIFHDWLRERRQTDNLIRNVWELVLVSALSESLDRSDAAYARKVFVDGFLSERTGWRVLIPKVGLGELFNARGAHTLRRLGFEVRTGQRQRQLCLSSAAEAQVVYSDENGIPFSDVVLAVPWHQVGELLPDDSRLDGLREQAVRLEFAPITSVHLWYDRPLAPLPHAVFVGRLSQWLFARGQVPDGRQLYQVVISNSRNLNGMSAEEIISRVQQELAEVFSAPPPPQLQHARVVTERRAVFAVTPGVDDHRPPQQTPITNLQLAGDWTRTGWPSTMESAAKSGFLAADNILQRHGLPANCTQPGLPPSMLSRWLFGLREEQKTAQ